MSALDLCLSVPQIPLLTAVLMFLIYKVLQALTKLRDAAETCCYPFFHKGMLREFGDLLRPGLWTKLGIERRALNSQPRKAAGRGSSTALWQYCVQHCHLSHCQNASQIAILTQRLLLSSAGSGCNAKYSLVCRSEQWPVKGRNLRANCVPMLALSLAGCYRQS